MILSCAACQKKFVVPDQAITSAGRVVQCGSCGNKWNQFPLINKEKTIAPNLKTDNKKTSKSVKPRKKKVRKTRDVSLYSPAYLAKKHGINLTDIETSPKNNIYEKVSFGFYNSLILFIVIIIFLSRGLYFFQDLIVEKFPITEFYLSYFFESVKNIFEILRNLIINY
jgi:predicted Zn finger-like uncharacterized protein|tara:strand:- start:55 stop:558 length:504 start_codon:yes stop_codon:yes gene_type:complete